MSGREVRSWDRLSTWDLVEGCGYDWSQIISVDSDGYDEVSRCLR